MGGAGYTITLVFPRCPLSEEDAGKQECDFGQQQYHRDHCRPILMRFYAR